MKLIMISLKIDPLMKQALEKLAKEQFNSISGILKRAADEYLKRHNIDWRDEDDAK